MPYPPNFAGLPGEDREPSAEADEAAGIINECAEAMADLIAACERVYAMRKHMIDTRSYGEAVTELYEGLCAVWNAMDEGLEDLRDRATDYGEFECDVKLPDLPNSFGLDAACASMESPAADISDVKAEISEQFEQTRRALLSHFPWVKEEARHA